MCVSALPEQTLQSEVDYSEVPAGEFIGLVLARQVEVEAELSVDAETKVVVHLYNLGEGEGEVEGET